MVNDKYYKGFEGENQVSLFLENGEILIIWEGYFYTLMELMFDQGYKILSDFYSEYDDEPWEINIQNAITQYRYFDINKVDKDKISGITNLLPQIIDEVLYFFEKALRTNQKVYILKE